MSLESTSPDGLLSYEVQRTLSPNILIVGETGAGKSSVINLIAGEQLADTSSRASGCTMEATSYDIVLQDGQGSGHYIRLFDTVGLNEPTLSKNDYLTAIQKANTLIIRLQRTGGIRLVIFCIRGGRITSVTQTNYCLFRDILCQNQVPVAFVITGMESENPMESWWTRNAAMFAKSKLFCTSHVCVTATRGLGGVYASQYEASQTAIRGMLLDHLSRASWKMEHTGWLTQLASKLLRWIAHFKDRKWPRSKPLTEDELARYLEDKCGFSPEDAKVLAENIWAQRMENNGPGNVKGEGAGYY